MIFPGHMAAAWLASRATRSDGIGALAACMFPDLVDKPIRWLFAATPNDRIPAHTALFWAGTSAAACRLAGWRFGRGWLVGYAAHLGCDEINAHLNPGRIYLWWPFKRYQMHRGPTGLESSLGDFTPLSFVAEAGMVVVAAAFVWWRGHRGPSRKPSAASSAHRARIDPSSLG